MLLLAENISLNDCWQEGIEYILSDQVEEAQAIWTLPFLSSDILIDEEQLNNSLSNYLLGVVEGKIITGEIVEAYKLTAHLRVIDSSSLSIALKFLDLSIRVKEFEPRMLADVDLTELIKKTALENIDVDVLNDFIFNISDLLPTQDNTSYIDFLQLVFSRNLEAKKIVDSLLLQVGKLENNYQNHYVKSEILKLCLQQTPTGKRFNILTELMDIHLAAQHLTDAISIGEQCLKEGEIAGSEKHLFGSHKLLSALMEAGDWKSIPERAKQHQQFFYDFITKSKNTNILVNSVVTTFFLNYLYDNPRLLHFLSNSVGEMYSRTISSSIGKLESNKNNCISSKGRKLRIGYIASTLYQHSVGWLSRWTFNYHNHSEFEIFIYHIAQPEDNPFNHKFFRDKADTAYYLHGSPEEIVNLIRKDKIDILIDLDSLGFATTYSVLCCKPAPIAVTWLGWDASGCPEIDYFMADPHVLPDEAEEYYSARIWRLPQTYIAIDGFEIEVPTKRRSDYHLPENAIVYLCAQKNYKHHPDILRLQMQIIKQVPNSYLMVQVRANPELLMNFYRDMADEVGISLDQIRFVLPDPDEVTHRANLQLVDVVLDTFPYNGATTSLETLWMGVPLVTKVGKSFVARNSYTFMQNVGVTEGIAHSDAEYVDWGVKLGTDLALRQQVMGKLLHSRKTSPLWNARSFTLEMENAYRQMWEIYQSQILAQQK
jgi:predicted O-linked N-acetylglucosamine transferase (SPINDLY family)